MQNKKKRMGIALVVLINACVLYGFLSDSTTANLNKVGGAQVTNVKDLALASPDQTFFTPGVALVLACPETPAAAGALVLATAAAYNYFFGENNQNQQTVNQYVTSVEAYKKYKLSKLDK